MKKELYNKVVLMQNTLIDCCTGRDCEPKDYEEARKILLDDPDVKNYLPDFVEQIRTTEQFWPYIKRKFQTYQERREYIWSSFDRLLEYLEKDNIFSDTVISISIKENATEYIKEQWNKALERRNTDPEGAITIARTLIETTCKYILDNLSVHYEEDVDLPKLYSLTANELNLSPQNHQEKIFKQILGGCHSVVNGLSSLRNKSGDAHGKGIRYVKPKERHAKLAVNLAGTLCAFLIETFIDKG